MKLLIVQSQRTDRDAAAGYKQDLPGWLAAAGHACSVYEPTAKAEAAKSTGLFKRLVRDDAADARFRKALAAFKPDAVYVVCLPEHQPPSLLRIAAREFKLPVVQFLPDYSHFCPARHCLRNGAHCDACLRRPVSGVVHRCVRHSASASLFEFLQMSHARWRNWHRDVSIFVCTNRRQSDLLAMQGVPASRIRLVSIPAPDMSEPIHAETFRHRDYVLYCGPIAAENGVDVLVRAFLGLGHRPESLILAGPAEPYYLDYLLDEGAELGRRLRIMPAQNRLARSRLLQGARVIAYPSLWDDCLPMGVVEGRSVGRAIVASDVGGLSGLVNDGHDGWLVRPGRMSDWSIALGKALETPDLARMEERARTRYLSEHAPQRHVAQLSDLFHQVLERGKHAPVPHEPLGAAAA